MIPQIVGNLIKAYKINVSEEDAASIIYDAYEKCILNISDLKKKSRDISKTKVEQCVKSVFLKKTGAIQKQIEKNKAELNLKNEIDKMEKIEPRYLMGTKAFHNLGELSSDDYDLFYANGETENYWIGSWVTGFGFFNICFPKETSRELNEEEIEKYNNSYVRINSQPAIKLNIS